MGEVLTTRQVAAELERTPRRVRQLADEAGLPLREDWTEGGPRLVICRAALDEWKRENWTDNRRRWYGSDYPA